MFGTVEYLEEEGGLFSCDCHPLRDSPARKLVTCYSPSVCALSVLPDQCHFRQRVFSLYSCNWPLKHHQWWHLQGRQERRREWQLCGGRCRVEKPILQVNGALPTYLTKSGLQKKVWESHEKTVV